MNWRFSGLWKGVNPICIAICLFLLLSACDITGQTKTSSTPLPTSVVTTQGDNWTMYHNDNVRTGYVAKAPDPQKLTSAWNVRLDGAVYAEPLVVDHHVIVATEGDTLYALDEQTGQEQWHTNVGQPVARATLPCGNVDPLGITGTPVYDPATKLIFAVAEVTGPAHMLVGVDIESGQIKVKRSVDLPEMEPRVFQQRAALALSQNIVYIAYGGLYGDCGHYRGTIIGSRTDGQGNLLSYQVPTPREGGIWAPPGPVIDKNNKLYVSVGNGEVIFGGWDHSDSVLRLSPTLQLEDGFAPQQWQRDNASDADLGSMGPVLLSNNLIFAAGKSGRGYVLHANALGGVGGQATEQEVCVAFGGSATTGSQIFIPCADGLLQVTIGNDASINRGWKASSDVSGSPIIGGRTVYSMGSGTLYAFNSENGAVRATVHIGDTSRFATPTLSGMHVFVGTMTGIVAATIS
jgi:outer membrane protein assembly factor BamB